MSAELDAVWKVLHEERIRVRDWKDPDYRAIFKQRSNRLRTIRAAGDQGWKLAFAYYKKHPLEAIEDWVTTYDPRKTAEGKPAYMPFVLFDKQREFLDWIYRHVYLGQNEGLCEKSREGGGSWVCLSFSWWLWTFHSGTKCILGSRVEDLVDQKGEPDSLFEKLRVIIRTLPTELVPLGFNEREHDNHMRLTNPENGSVIGGEAGDNIGRGGRGSLAFIDEAAFLNNPLKVDAALSETTRAKVWLSTPNFPGDWFARRRFGGKIEVFTLPWQDDPRKDEAWYKHQVATKEEEVVAREIDLDYEGKGTNIICPANHVRASVELRKIFEAKNLIPARHAGVAGLDVGGGGSGKSVFIPRWGPVVGHTVESDSDDAIDIANWARRQAQLHNCDIILYDSIGVGFGVTSQFRRLPDVRKSGINVGNKPTRKIWPDGKKSRDKFTHLKGELWWEIRDKLANTYKHWLHVTTGGAKGELQQWDELILLPDDPKLRLQLSQPLYDKMASGKIQPESKKQMKSRGIDSPDHAEALTMTYGPQPRRGGSNRAVGLY